MAEERKPLENTEGIYVGKEFLGSGEGKSGAFSRYKLKFKPKMDSNKGFSFTCFDKLKAKNTKQLTDLKEGERYKVLYSSEERANKAGQTYTSKTIIGLYNPESKDSNPKQDAPKTALQPNLANFDKFKEKYLTKMKEAKIEPNAFHMLGSFIASTEKARVEALLHKCIDALKNG